MKNLNLPRAALALTAANKPPILSVRRLNASFKTDGVWTTVVRDLDFHISPNETVAMVGESGSGKTVTALAIMRLLPKANGRVEGYVELNGQNLLDLPEEHMREIRGGRISMIFQEPMTSLNPVLTVGFQVVEALRYHRDMDRAEAERAALKLFDEVRLPNARKRFHDYPHRFSGGMRQRIMIAMALACRPSLLIADEPTTALDVTIQAQILDLIKLLQLEYGMSVMFITHDMGVVAEIADRIVVMWRGHKVEEGASQQIFTAPEHPYTKSLLAAVPCLGSMKGTSLPRKFPNIRPHRIEGGESTLAVTSDSNDPSPRNTVRSSEAPLLEVSGLTTRFDILAGTLKRLKGRVHAVENVSFTLHAGETLALVGESGCGKSTTGRSILRLVQPSRGRISFEGKDILGLGTNDLRAERRHMQMIFQDPFASLNPRKMAGSSIAEPMLVHGLVDRAEADERVAGLLKKVGLGPEHALRYPHEFSGGQRQRLCIARALGLNPKLIIADEVVSMLDVTIKAQVINLMMELQDELALAYLLISHDIAIVERISHRVAVMYLGEIVEIGPRQEVFEDPRHPYTRKLMKAVPVADPRQRRVGEPRLSSDEIPSPIKSPGYEPEPKYYLEVTPGHYVQQCEA
ncbi:MAG: ABC transporter ATP-binding protein [Thermodesulfobacteriota bacterium]